MKMTTVEWLERNMRLNMHLHSISELFQLAKQMEKDQILNAYNQGEFDQGCNGTAQDYYDKTYKQPK